uniref:alpha/beta hydrolase family protein n=1 Tax=Pedobacter schmidteae TaxID=2201271 RepID=UPI000EAE20F0|nr:acetylxylan esterase [Pedobacter schmidteae]
MNKLILNFMVLGVLITSSARLKAQHLPRVFSGQQEDLIALDLKKAAKAAASRLKLPSSKSDWERYKQNLKLKIGQSAGIYINHNLPLKMQQTAELQMEGFSIKNILFQTRPGVYATANLYVPNGQGPFPAVVVTHGHWPDARRSELFQSVAQVLASAGYVALTIDAWGAGERCTEDGRQEYHGANLGASLMNAGESLLGMQLSDNIRAIDLLCELGYVDKNHIGATGASGGGNQTMWLAALDERVKAAIPVVSVGTFQSYIMNSNCVCELLPEGLTFTEEAAVLGMIAPRALKIFSARNDTNKSFFPSEMLKSYTAAVPVFDFYRTKNKIAYQIFDTGHGYWPEMRDAMLGWFDLQLKQKGDGTAVRSTKVKPLPAAELVTFKQGQRPATITTTAEFCRDQENGLHKQLIDKPVWDARTKVKALKQILGMGTPAALKNVKSAGFENGWEKLILKNTTGAEVPILFKAPAKGSHYTIMNHSGGKDSIPAMDIKALTDKGQGIVLVDLWGTGEQRSDTAIKIDGALPPFHTLSRSTLWLGRTIMGNWIQDIQIVDSWLKQKDKKRVLQIYGYKETGVAGLLYTVFNEAQQVTLVDAPYSYRFDERKGIDFYNMAIHIPGMLKWGDISLVAALSDTSVLFREARSMSGRPINDEQKKRIVAEFNTLRKYTQNKKTLTFTEINTN